MSIKELQGVVHRAQKWTGARGNKRRVRFVWVCVFVCLMPCCGCCPQIAVCEYALTDPLDASFVEVTTHIVIYTSSLDGSKELYRCVAAW